MVSGAECGDEVVRGRRSAASGTVGMALGGLTGA